MFCKNCGKEIQEGWNVCPNCGVKHTEIEENRNSINREYHFIGMRRNGKSDDVGGEDGGERVGIHTDVIIEGDKIRVFRSGKPSSEKQFNKQDVKNIDLPLLPVWWVSDFIRFAVFGLLMFFTYGLSIFALLYSIKIMMSRHIRIKLLSGKVVKIPIRQKADASEFLEELNYSPVEIEKNNSEKIDEQTWYKREKLVSGVMFGIAAIAIGLGFNLMRENIQNLKSKEVMRNILDSEDEHVIGVKQGHPYDYPNITYGDAFDNFFGSPTWKYFEAETGEDVVEFTGYCTYQEAEVKSRLQFILEEDGTITYGAMSFNDVPQSEVITALMIEKAFETYMEDNGISTEEDTDVNPPTDATAALSTEKIDETKKADNSDMQEFILPDSDSRYLSEEEIRSIEADNLRIARNEIFARHGYIFNDEELNKYFNSTSWYQGSVPSEQFNMNEALNDFEKKNVELIEKVEGELDGTKNEQDSEEFVLPEGTYVNNELFEDYRALMTLTFYDGDEVGVEFSTEPQLNSISLYGLKIDNRTIQVTEEYEGITVTLTWDSETEVTATSSGEFMGMDSSLFNEMTNAHYSLAMGN